MTIAVDWNVKQQNQSTKKSLFIFIVVALRPQPTAMVREIHKVVHRILVYYSNSMFLSFFSAILIGLFAKLNRFYTLIETHAYEYLISALISQS